ncbi:MAG: metalloprotease PmbA [Gammaproteobacteria bacterium RBG_16_57_12]|nr:MAG: metalloprotease PmbA [Gammaproteobacteria bacterium RBG_16_57_12]
MQAPSATTEHDLEALLGDVLREAKAQGASAAEAAISTGAGLSVTVRLGEVETVEFTRDKGMGITVYFGQRKGSASTSDFSKAALRDSVLAACHIAKFTAADDCNGLADAALMARAIPDLDLHHPWTLTVEQAIDLARRCEATALTHDPRIRNSEGATLDSHSSRRVYGNSHGFVGGYPSTRHSISCSVIAEHDDEMQRDYWYDTARDSRDLAAVEQVGRLAAERAVSRLQARKLSTRQAPVLFSADIARGLWSSFIGAISGSRLYRRASFLVDSLGEQLYPESITIFEQPHLRKALGSAPFDSEGVATKDREIIRAGVLQGYVLDSYSARKLGMQTTGNAGGVHNLGISHGELDLAGLIKHMHQGLLVTELMGHGINTVTGDYSRGAAGFWVEGGTIQYPVEEITIAGNLREMFRNIVAVGRDTDCRGNIRTGSVLLGHMTIAGD